MKIGLVTYKPEYVEGFDPHVYYSKWVDGQVFPPAKGMQNDVTVFCDAKAIREDPSIVAISKTVQRCDAIKEATLSLTMFAQQIQVTAPKLWITSRD
jgi:hypothetical protein